MEEPIVSTPGHKYYLPENTKYRELYEVNEHASYYGLNEKWVSACNLKKGDKVLLSDGKYGIVKEIKTEKCEEFTTYNFEVADYHTYYVGENGVLVHNAKCGLVEQSVPDGYEPTFKNGTYDPNPKHGMVQHGKSSPKLSSPEYGQYALGNAIAAPRGKALYAYNGKNILQFMPSNNAMTIWHGFTTNLAGINSPQAASFLLHYFNL